MTAARDPQREAFEDAIFELMGIRLPPELPPETILSEMPNGERYAREGTLGLLFDIWQEATRRASARPLTPIGTVRVSAWSVSWRTADNALFKIGAAAPGKYEVFIRAAAAPEEKEPRTAAPT